jgi:hypothetical protein
MSSRRIRNPWTFVRCRVAGRHRWVEVVGDDELDSGWRCSDCGELVLQRHIAERDYEPEVKSPYWGRRRDPPAEV